MNKQLLLMSSCLEANRAKIAKKYMRKVSSLMPINLRVIEVLSIQWVTRNGYSTNGFVDKIWRIKTRCGARSCTVNFSCKCFLFFPRITTRFYRQLYRKMKTLNFVFFLAGRFPSNVTCKFVYPVSFVFKWWILQN